MTSAKNFTDRKLILQLQWKSVNNQSGMFGVETAKSEVNTDAQWSNLSVTYGRNDDVVQKGTEGDGETGREWDGEQA